MMTFLFHVLLAVSLFYLINWIGQHSSGLGYTQLTLFVRPDEAPAFNFLLRALSPAVFVILVAVALYTAHLDQFTADLWRVALYYYAFRLLVNATLGRAHLMSWALFSFRAIFGTAATYLAYRELILPRTPLFPDVQTIGNELWIAIALFVYATLNSVKTSDAASARRMNRYLGRRMANLRREYSGLIEGQFPNRYMELVAYAILVHENFNRPAIVRWLERALFPHWSRTLGIMQVATDRRISDAESVALGVSKLKQHFEQTCDELDAIDRVLPESVLIERTVAKYNRDDQYVAAVWQLVRTIALQIATDYRTDYERLFARPAAESPRPSTAQDPPAPPSS